MDQGRLRVSQMQTGDKWAMRSDDTNIRWTNVDWRDINEKAGPSTPLTARGTGPQAVDACPKGPRITMCHPPSASYMGIAGGAGGTTSLQPPPAQHTPLTGLRRGTQRRGQRSVVPQLTGPMLLGFHVVEPIRPYSYTWYFQLQAGRRIPAGSPAPACSLHPEAHSDTSSTPPDWTTPQHCARLNLG